MCRSCPEGARQHAPADFSEERRLRGRSLPVLSWAESFVGLLGLCGPGTYGPGVLMGRAFRGRALMGFPGRFWARP